MTSILHKDQMNINVILAKKNHVQKYLLNTYLKKCDILEKDIL